MSTDAVSLDDFLTNVDPEAVRVRIRVGRHKVYPGRRTFDLEKGDEIPESWLFDLVHDTAQELGWGSAHPTVRVELLNAKGTCPAGWAWQLTEKLPDEVSVGMSSSDPVVIHHRSWEANMREMRRMVSESATVIGALGSCIHDLTVERFALLERVEMAHDDAREAEHAAVMLATEAEARDLIEAAQGDDDPQSLLLGVLDVLQGKKYNPASLAAYARRHPEQAVKLLQDPTVASAVRDAAQAQAAAAEGQGAGSS